MHTYPTNYALCTVQVTNANYEVNVTMTFHLQHLHQCAKSTRSSESEAQIRAWELAHASLFIRLVRHRAVTRTFPSNILRSSLCVYVCFRFPLPSLRAAISCECGSNIFVHLGRLAPSSWADHLAASSCASCAHLDAEVGIAFSKVLSSSPSITTLPDHRRSQRLCCQISEPPEGQKPMWWFFVKPFSQSKQSKLYLSTGCASAEAPKPVLTSNNLWVRGGNSVLSKLSDV